MHRKQRRLITIALIVAAVAALMVTGRGFAKKGGDPATLGEALYFDADLSEPSGQACASCHEPSVGFDDPDSELPVSEGVILGEFGGRNSPISAYAMYAPAFHYDATEGLWIGGQFWDGRATGDVLGDPLADQALGPFLNPVEMANPDKATVIADIAASEYADLFIEVWGNGSLNNVDKAYDKVALSIAAFERTDLFAAFDSKYDAYLAKCLKLGGLPDDCAQGIGAAAWKAGHKVFTGQEWDGLRLFMGENDNNGVMEPGEGAFCSACHVADWTMAADYALPVVVPRWAPDGMVPPVFTDFTFDNLGVPKSEHELLAGAAVDLGLGAVVGDPAENGNSPFAHFWTKFARVALKATYGSLAKSRNLRIRFCSAESGVRW